MIYVIDFAAMLDKSDNAEGFVINPYGESLTFNRLMIESLKAEKDRKSNNGAVEYVVKEDTTVLLGQPKEYPHELVNAIATQLKKMKNVKAAFLQLMINGNEKGFLLVVDFTGEKRVTFDIISKIAAPYLNGMYLDMVSLDSDFGCNAVKNFKPFYKKKKLNIF